jgi:ppGpp synthetase/RelA/SpoT-type nucleotidyltranferase
VTCKNYKEYQEAEQQFLKKFWFGKSRDDVLGEISQWIKWDLPGVSVHAMRCLRDVAKRFSERMNQRLRKAWSGYEDRFVAELDSSHDRKTPGRVLDKMVRAWMANGCSEEPPLRPDNYRTELPDALRYRYVVNFIEDGERLFKMLCKEAKSKNKELAEIFKLETGSRKCSVHDRLNKRKRGERSWKLRLVHKGTGINAEVQVCTLLQVSWDKKDHFLIYERERRGVEVAPGDKIVMKHVSDQLYVVDRQLDELYKSTANSRKIENKSDLKG